MRILLWPGCTIQNSILFCHAFLYDIYPYIRIYYCHMHLYISIYMEVELEKATWEWQKHRWHTRRAPACSWTILSSPFRSERGKTGINEILDLEQILRGNDLFLLSQAGEFISFLDMFTIVKILKKKNLVLLSKFNILMKISLSLLEIQNFQRKNHLLLSILPSFS